MLRIGWWAELDQVGGTGRRLQVLDVAIVGNSHPEGAAVVGGPQLRPEHPSVANGGEADLADVSVTAARLRHLGRWSSYAVPGLAGVARAQDDGARRRGARGGAEHEAVV